MKINEEQIKNKYKYYKTDMLLSVLKENKKLLSEEVAIIQGIINEKNLQINSDRENKDRIIYGVLKDKIIIATCWHILIFAVSIFVSFLYRQRDYPWHWIEAFVACLTVLVFGLFSAFMMLIFFTERSKGLFYKNYIRFSLIGVVVLWITYWNHCRISYTCN
ncbi:hypothetical protein B9Z34_10655 [Limnohabitans sp. Hippo3]|nr:hypothetical protein B9Z34_10655 [Limnohabitans sp. Hippo3]